MKIDEWEEKYGRLYSLPYVTLMGTEEIGLILEYTSGIAYHHQIGGLSCIDKRIEGVYMPIGSGFLRDQPSVLDQLNKYFLDVHGGRCDGGINNDDANFIDTTLLRFERDLISIKTDRSKLSESMEAWIYVNIEILSDNPRIIETIIGNVETTKAVLIWPNSD